MPRGLQYAAKFEARLPPPFIAPNFGWHQNLAEPFAPYSRRPTYPKYGARSFGFAPQPAPNLGWLQELSQPDRPVVQRARPLAEHPAHVLTLVEPFVSPSIGWAQPLSEPVRPCPIVEHSQPTPFIFVPPTAQVRIGWLSPLAEPLPARRFYQGYDAGFVDLPRLSFGWHQAWDGPTVAHRLYIAADGNVVFVPPAGATGFFNLGWLQQPQEPERPLTRRARPLAEHPAHVVASSQPFASPSLGWYAQLSEPLRRVGIAQGYESLPPTAILPGLGIGWLQPLQEPVQAHRLYVGPDGNVLFIAPAGFAGFFNTGWIPGLNTPDRTVTTRRPAYPRYNKGSGSLPQQTPGASGFFNVGWIVQTPEPLRQRKRWPDAEDFYFVGRIGSRIAAWHQPWQEPTQYHRLYLGPDVNPIFIPAAGATGFFNLGWLRPLEEPNRPRRPVSENPEPFYGLVPPAFVAPSVGWHRPLDEPLFVRRIAVGIESNVFFSPFLNLGWLRPLDEPSRPRRPLPEFTRPVDAALPPIYVSPSAGWVQPLQEPTFVRRVVWPPEGNVFFIPVPGATGFFNLGWLRPLDEPNRPRRPLAEFPEPAYGLVPPAYVSPSIGWLRALDEPNRPRRPMPEFPEPALWRAVPAFVAPSFGWHQALVEPNVPRRPIPEFPQPVPYFFVPPGGATGFFNLGWLRALDEPNRPRRPIPEFPVPLFALAAPVFVPSVGWLRPLDEPVQARRQVLYGPSGDVLFTPSVAPSFGWHRALDLPIVPARRFLVDAAGNVFFTPSGGATGFFNLGWLQPFQEPNVPRRPLPEFPASFLGYTPQVYAPIGATFLAPALIRALVAEILARDVAPSPERVRTATLVPNWPMSQAQDLVPPIDADGEEETIGFDFGPAINALFPKLDSGVILSGTPTITCMVSAVSPAQDPSPSSRILSAPSLVASKRTGAPKAQWNVLFGNAVAGVTYLLQCVAPTSDGQQLSIWVRLPAVSPS